MNNFLPRPIVESSLCAAVNSYALIKKRIVKRRLLKRKAEELIDISKEVADE